MLIKYKIIASNQALAFGVFQQSLLFPNERWTSSHGWFDISMGVFKARFETQTLISHKLWPIIIIHFDN